MSDPDVVIDGSNRILVWADGDNSNCGGFSSALLESDMRTTVSRSVRSVIINGVGVLGNCGGKGRPYLEGASLYKVNGTWRMFFAAKPTSVPPECASSVGGPNSANEVIAWATAGDPQGPYTYRGFDDCIRGAAHDFQGWHMVDPQYPNHPPLITAPGAGASDLQANRYAVGPWERYRMVPRPVPVLASEPRHAMRKVHCGWMRPIHPGRPEPREPAAGARG